MDLVNFKKDLVTYITEKHSVHTIILYGSYSTGDFTEDSDIDVLCFTDVGEEKNDTGLFEGKRLDVWIYPDEKLQQPDQFLHVHKGEILLDEKGLAGPFLEEVERIYEEGPSQMSESEKDFLKNWLRKMNERSKQDDFEGNYRYHWMLRDSLGIYFELKGVWYPGSKKAVRWLEEHDPTAYALFTEVYKKEVDHQAIDQLLDYLEKL
ncbi:nucleotidyltransferase domain-containing protein [Pseudalkalibacillus sp. SCS-8]|uniref:nucleotidyltransferase domain-containing protein n=1 Tax=Pseudalkalibacillus nanhaiensis TaxID=3115291 RepID=UPI0032D9B174